MQVAGPSPSSWHAPGVVDEEKQVAADLGPVLGAQVDLVIMPVDAECVCPTVGAAAWASFLPTADGVVAFDYLRYFDCHVPTLNLVGQCRDFSAFLLAVIGAK
jgi:hypothetical protein